MFARFILFLIVLGMIIAGIYEGATGAWHTSPDALSNILSAASVILNAASLVLTGVAIVIASLALFGWAELKRLAAEAAREEAEKAVSKIVAQIKGEPPDYGEADQIAESQPRPPHPPQS